MQYVTTAGPAEFPQITCPQGELENMPLHTTSKSSFLVGMAMVFGFGTPLSNRLLDSVILRRGGGHAWDSVAQDWRSVAQDLNFVISNPDSPEDESEG